MGLMDAFEKTPETTIKITTLYDLLDRSARLEYLQRAIVSGVKRSQMKEVFKLKSVVEDQQEVIDGDPE